MQMKSYYIYMYVCVYVSTFYACLYSTNVVKAISCFLLGILMRLLKIAKRILMIAMLLI